MLPHRLSLFAALILAAAAGPLAAQQPPSYARQLKPFFARYCLECHSGPDADGGLNLETYKGLRAGGDHGAVLTPGQPDASRIVRMVEGIKGPFMPPKKSKQPSAAEKTLLRAWIAAGARDDSTAARLTVPVIRPKVAVAAPVAALAYHPGGKLLAAGVRREVLLLDPATGDVQGRLGGQRDRVTALAFARDGRRLAVASQTAGEAYEVRLYDVPTPPARGAKDGEVVNTHQDVIYDLAFSPDGKLLASCGYDRVIRLWDVAAPVKKELRVLTDHSDAVYGVAFSPDGKLLASASADRAVKVWDVAGGTRLYTLGEATDWLYAVAWSPDGRHLAAAGVDKSIRVWEVSAQGGRIAHSVFAHEGPVTRLAYAADGQTLYSLSEDHSAKAWDAGRMVERRVYPRQPEATLALAVRPDQKQLALGRYDGALVLLDEATGKVQSQPLPVKPKPPVLHKLTPAAGPRGRELKVRLEGKHLRGATAVTAPHPGIKAVLSPPTRDGAVEVTLTVPATTPAGAYPLRVQTPAGQSAPLPFTVDLFAPVPETEPNDSPRTAQKVTLPATLVGAIGRAGDVDFYRFEARAGQEVGAQVLTGALGSKLEPVLQLTDADGRVLVESDNGLLGYTCPRAGTYALGIRDRDYRGGPGMHYRLHAGDVPVVTAVFPLGLQRGTEAEVRVEGVHLGGVRSVRVRAPADAAPGSRLPVALTTPAGAPLGNPTVVVGEFPEALAAAKASLPVPGTANGVIATPGATDTWRFAAKKGRRLLLEVNARRLGSPLDSVIEVLDARGQPLPLATLRCLAKTYVMFRDHDSNSPGVRIETWGELAVNDYLLVGSELIRIRALPRNPDDDCQFFAEGGRRLAYLGTTPLFHPMGQPMYKVSIHPPGATFPPNGLPVVTLYHRNDDGGAGFGKDSRLVFDPPADGDYRVRVGDARGQGGPRHAYRLTVRPPQPDFTVRFSPTAPAVAKGGALPIGVTAQRIDGFEGEIDLRLLNLPPGFSAPATSIPAGENSTSFALYAEPTAAVPAKAAPLELGARAVIDGREVVRKATGGVPRVVAPGDIGTTTEQSEVTVKAGGEARVTVTVERRHGFKGRIPLDVRGLPHGVRVLDVGLNGILVTEQETRRTFVLYAEPWVKPMTHPFVVLARREGKNSEHAARSVLLRVSGK
jgi:WD40 repeat protein